MIGMSVLHNGLDGAVAVDVEGKVFLMSLVAKKLICNQIGTESPKWRN
jgi:hypothetical protein